jgi:hypothetical protein
VRRLAVAQPARLSCLARVIGDEGSPSSGALETLKYALPLSAAGATPLLSTSGMHLFTSAAAAAAAAAPAAGPAAARVDNIRGRLLLADILAPALATTARLLPPPSASGTQVYILTGGGAGQGKAVHSGKRAVFLSISASGWCTMLLCDSGEEISWRRSCLRALQPSGALADEAPSCAALMSSADAPTQKAAAVMQQRDMMTQLTQPPPRASSLGVAPVTIFLDLEIKPYGISEIAASA